MKPLDEELRAALRREEPSEGFAGRVLARIATSPARESGWWPSLRAVFRAPRFRWAAAAVAACLLVAAVVVHHRREQRLKMEGEMAKVQVMKALRIASSKLNMARRKVRDIDRDNPQS